MEVSTTTKIVGWITEQFIKYELNKLTVRNFFIGTTAVSILAYFGKKGYAFITEKKLPTSGFVLVTGAGAGLGYATTVYLAEKGFSVIAAVRSQQDVERLRDLSTTIKGGSVTPILMDVTSEESVRIAVAEITKLVGGQGLRGLVNNAGTATTGPVEYLPVETWKSVYEVNMFGLIRVTQQCLPLLAKNKNGRILNLSSPASWVPLPLWGPYCTSKAALNMFSDILRLEVINQNIKVITLEPAALKSRLVGVVLEESRGMSQKKEWSLYAKAIEANRKFGEQSHGNANDPALCGKKALEALTVANPKYKYAFGSSPPAIIKYMGTSAYIWFWQKVYGL